MYTSCFGNLPVRVEIFSQIRGKFSFIFKTVDRFRFDFHYDYHYHFNPIPFLLYNIASNTIDIHFTCLAAMQTYIYKWLKKI